MIPSPSLTSIFLRSSPPLPPLLTLISICFLSPPLAPSLLLLPAPSYLHLSQSRYPQYQPPLVNFRFQQKATARRLDAYCCYRNRPSALDHNVTLSPCQGYNVCSFYVWPDAGLPIFCLSVCLSVRLSMRFFFYQHVSCHLYEQPVILMSSFASSYIF